MVGVALGLHVHDVKSQGIQAYQPVQARIARAAEMLRGSFQATVSHLHQQAKDELLQEHGRLLDRCVQVQVGDLQSSRVR
jgi:hypothetical protein